MKKLILLLLFSATMFAQEKTQKPHVYFSGGFDVRNLAFGSSPTKDKSELNYTLQFVMVGNNNVEAGIGFEEFNRIDFNRMFANVGYRFSLSEKSILIVGIEPSLINRYDDWGGGISYKQKSSFMTIAGYLAFEYKITEKFSTQFVGGLLPRPDNKMMYDVNKITPSFVVKVQYKIFLIQ